MPTETLGFKEKIGSGEIGRFGQEFKYYTSSLYADQLRELELKFYTEDHSVKLFFELKLGVGLMHSGAEHHTELAIPSEMLARGSVRDAAGYIKEFLENELRQVSLHGPRAVPGYEQYQHVSGRPGFGGFIGGIAAGLLGAAMLNSLFDVFDNQETGGGEPAVPGDDSDGGGFDYDFGGFDDEF